MDLQSSIERERVLFESASDGIIEATLDGKVVSVNSAAQEILARPRKDLIGKSFDSLVAKEDLARLYEKFSHIQQPGAVDVSEWKLIRGDGSIVDVEISAKMYFGNLICGFVRDITERKRHEAQLAFLAKISNQMAETNDFHRRIQIAAEMMVPQYADLCVISMVEGDEVYFRAVKARYEETLSRLHPSTLRERLKAENPLSPRTVLHTGEPLLVQDVAAEFYARTDIGEDYVQYVRDMGVTSFVTLPLVSRGKVVGLFNLAMQSDGKRFSAADLPFLREVANRCAVSFENAHLFYQAKAAVHARELVLSIVSHDLRNPMASIDLAVQILNSSYPLTESSLRRATTRIQNALRSTERLISDLLDFGKIQSGSLSVRFEPSAVEAIVHTAIDTFQYRCAEKNLRLNSQLEPNLPPINCDHTRILQVLWNLIGNSIKFTPSGGEIRIEAKPQDEFVHFIVADTGCGIDPQDVENVFERFWQSKETRDVGYGLGLSIAKGIVLSHGGKMWVESQKSGGTKVHFTVPIATKAMQRSEESELSNGTGRPRDHLRGLLEGTRILAVDDSPEVLVMLKMLFERAGAEFYCAESVLPAVEMARSLVPDVVITDIEMEGANGFDLLACIRQMGNPNVCQVPVVAMSAHSDQHELSKIQQAGFQFLVSKPFTAESLVRDLAALPLKRRAQLALEF